MITSEEINDHLRNGGYIQVSTYTKSSIYGPKWEGSFFMRNDELTIRKGKRTETLSFGDHLLVGIKFLIKKGQTK